MQQTFAIKTFGCQMNISDSERITGLLQPLGWSQVEYEENPNLVIFNTCSIRKKAEDRVMGMIHNLGKLKEKNPDLRIGITGCMVKQTGIRRDILSSEREDLVSLDPLFQVIPHADFVFRIEDLTQLADQLDELYPMQRQEQHDNNGNNKDFHFYLNIKPQYKTSSQISVPIMTGCNHFCSYCVVPFTRGREISRPLAKIIEEITIAAEQGATEVTLLGQNVNSYQMGDDATQSFYHQRNKKSDFVILLEEIDKISGITRVRYTSSHPRDFDDDLIQAHVNLKSMCDYVHLPVQSGDNEVLKSMRREYHVEEFIEKIKRLRQAVPSVTLSTDMIVGFCGETEKQFENTLRFVKEVEFDLIYLAQYSPRKGTLSGERMEDDVPHAEKLRRWHAVNDALEEVVYKRNQQYADQTLEVLVEESKKGFYVGKARNWKSVRFSSDHEDLVGKVVNVKITTPKTWILEGAMVEVVDVREGSVAGSMVGNF